MADSGPKDDSENGSISETMKEAFANPLTDDDDEEEEILAVSNVFRIERLLSLA